MFTATQLRVMFAILEQQRVDKDARENMSLAGGMDRMAKKMLKAAKKGA